MGIEPTPNLKTKRLPSAGGTVWNASEATGTISGRELDVSPDVSRNSTDYGGGVGHRRPELLKVAQHVVLSSQNLCFWGSQKLQAQYKPSSRSWVGQFDEQLLRKPATVAASELFGLAKLVF